MSRFGRIRRTAPTIVNSKRFTLRVISQRADPEWPKIRDFNPAYKFGGRVFIDHRDNVYQPVPAPLSGDSDE